MALVQYVGDLLKRGHLGAEMETQGGFHMKMGGGHSHEPGKARDLTS